MSGQVSNGLESRKTKAVKHIWRENVSFFLSSSFFQSWLVLNGIDLNNDGQDSFNYFEDLGPGMISGN